MKLKVLLVTSAVVLVVIFAFVLYSPLTTIQHPPNISSTSSQLPSVESDNSSLPTRSVEGINSTSSQSRSANPDNSPYSSCLLEVPNDAIIDYLSVSVTYSNGTRVGFPIYSCLRPAYPVQYRIGLAVGSTQKFIAKENGSFYALQPFATIDPGYTQYSYTSATVTCSTNAKEGGVHGCFPYIVLLFTLYSNQTIRICDGSSSRYKQLGEIQVEISLNATGGIDLSRMSIFKLTEPDLNIVHCTTIVTATIPGSTTS